MQPHWFALQCACDWRGAICRSLGVVYFPPNNSATPEPRNWTVILANVTYNDLTWVSTFQHKKKRNLRCAEERSLIFIGFRLKQSRCFEIRDQKTTNYNVENERCHDYEIRAGESSEVSSAWSGASRFKTRLWHGKQGSKLWAREQMVWGGQQAVRELTDLDNTIHVESEVS